jgi:hypothetical protein
MNAEFPDINIADLAEVLERRGVTRPDAKLDGMLKKINQKKVKAAAAEVADFSGKIDAAYNEVARQLKEKELI